MGNSKSKQQTTPFINVLCLDVHAEIFGFLEANDQAQLRATAKHFRTVFNHAFQRGYVAAAIHDDYVEKLDAMHEDGEDGHPLLRVAPVDLKGLFWKHRKKMHRSEEDKEATLFVNMRLLLGSGGRVLGNKFLTGTLFAAVHVYGTETLEIVEGSFGYDAGLRTFTMTTPCPKLVEIADFWLNNCKKLTHFDISGCCALQRVGRGWLCGCESLRVATFAGCRRLQRIDDDWMRHCSSLRTVDFAHLGSLETVGDRWLYDCGVLQVVHFYPCVALRSIGLYCLSCCQSLKTVDLRDCVSLESVSDCRFMGFVHDLGTAVRVVISDHQNLLTLAEHLLARRIPVVLLDEEGNERQLK